MKPDSTIEDSNTSKNNSKTRKPLEKSESNIIQSITNQDDANDHYPRKIGYFKIFLLSLTNLLSILDVEPERRSKIMCIVFAAVSTFLSFYVSIFHRLICRKSGFSIQKVYGGKLEGCLLLFLCLWWFCGVTYMTKNGGVAYLALNIYVSSWGSLFASMYAFNKWLSSEDMVSFKELTRLSPTLPWWYILLFSSVVEMGSAVHFYMDHGSKDDRLNDYASISVGALSVFVSILVILYHYKIIECCFKAGGHSEFMMALILCILWIFLTGRLTQRGKRAATIIGDTCTGAMHTGSNLYLSLWISFFSTIFIMESWMYAKALQLASKSQDEEFGVDKNDDDDDESKIETED